MLDRCTGASTNEPCAGMCSVPCTSTRPSSFAAPRISRRMKPYTADVAGPSGFEAPDSRVASGTVQPPEDLVDHVVDRLARRVDENGVVGPGQRAVVPALVERIPAREVG